MKRSHPEFKQAQTTVQFLLGPIKIKDGLFMGDQLAARDIQFIISNKVTHIINTVSKVIPNLYERFGVHYLSVHWSQKQENIFDKKNNAINAIFTFIEQAMEQGESCLIHSINSKSRACAVLSAYLMKKYSWSLSKCLQFINSKKENLQIRNNFLKELQDLEKRMMESNRLSANWNEVKNEDDLVLANTFYNSKKSQPKEETTLKKNSKKKVVWDQKLVHKANSAQQQASLYSTMSKFKQTLQRRQQPLHLKSILKGFTQDNQAQPEQLQEFQQHVKLIDDRFISTINGNIVHVTVNNFINTDKKAQMVGGKLYNTRPYSSDSKEREKKAQQNQIQIKMSKLFPYENNNLASTFKNPYEMKLIGKIGSKVPKKKEQIKNPMMAYERPQSANIAAQRKKIRMNQLLPNAMMGSRQEMMVTGQASKKRYPSTNPKEDPYKWK